jgi:hypothetical protein
MAAARTNQPRKAGKCVRLPFLPGAAQFAALADEAKCITHVREPHICRFGHRIHPYPLFRGMESSASESHHTQQ